MRQRLQGMVLAPLFMTGARIGSLFFRVKKKRKDSALIIPCAAPGSAGDEAMANVCYGELTKKHKSILFLSHCKAGEWDFIGADARSSEPLEILAKQPMRNFHKILKLLRTMAEYEEAYFIGGDTIDGHYDKGIRSAFVVIALLYFLAKTGTAVTIIGSSFNAHPQWSSTLSLRHASSIIRICARDPLSFQRMQERGITCMLTADSAFLLKPAKELHEDYSALLEAIEKSKNSGHLIIGINTHFIDLHTEEKKNAAVQSLIRTMQSLAEKQLVTFVFIGQDDRTSHAGADSDFQMIERIMDALTPHLRVCSLRNYPTHSSETQIRRICRALDIAVSGSMHFTIACLAETVPAFNLAYQDKFEGLLQHFALPKSFDMPVSALAEHGRQFLHHIEELIERRDEISNSIQEKLPNVLELAKRNFA